MTAVHYRGAAPALTDLIAGHINAVIMGPSVALSSVKAGKLKMLAFGSEKRMPQFPDVPTIAETVPGYEASVSFGLFAAAGTPADIVKKVNADVQAIVTDPEFRKKYLERFAVEPVPGPLEVLYRISAQGLGQMGRRDQKGECEDRVSAATGRSREWN